MSRRHRYPEGSVYNVIDDVNRRGYRRGFNARRWSWRFYLLSKSAPAIIALLALVSVVGLLLRAQG